MRIRIEVKEKMTLAEKLEMLTKFGSALASLLASYSLFVHNNFPLAFVLGSITILLCSIIVEEASEGGD